LDGRGELGVDPLVGGEDTARDSAVPKELGAVAFGGDAEADGLAGIGDGRQALQLAGPGERLDVEQVLAVVLGAADADDAAALFGGDGDPVRVDEVALARQEG
jgi:hypothetical protein